MTHDPTAKGQNWAEEPAPGAASTGPPNTLSPRPALVASLVSLLLGLLSVFLLLKLLAGIPALLLGFLSLRRLNALPGAVQALAWGKRCAVAGMVLGLAGSVLGVIGLVSIVLLRVTEDSRRLACVNNLRQLGFAVLDYNDVNTGFPTAAVDPHADLAGFAPWRNPPYVKRLSWMVELLPYLGRSPEGEAGKGRNRRAMNADKFQALSNRFDVRQPWDAAANAEPADTRVDLFVCPSHPRSNLNEKPAPTDYVGIAGVGEDAAFLPKESRRAGFFGYQRHLTIDRRVGTNDLPAGTSHTMVCAETTRDNGPWVAADRSTVRPLYPEDLPYIGLQRQFGGCHPGGANLLKVDASVEFFSDRGDPEVLERLAVLGRGDW